MRETITVNRIGICPLLGKEVAQQISTYILFHQDADAHTSKILTKYCSGEDACHSSDCQFIVGVTGKAYTKSIEAIARLV